MPPASGHHCACGLHSTAAGLKRHLTNAKSRGEDDVHYAVPAPAEDQPLSLAARPEPLAMLQGQPQAGGERLPRSGRAAAAPASAAAPEAVAAASFVPALAAASAAALAAPTAEVFAGQAADPMPPVEAPRSPSWLRDLGAAQQKHWRDQRRRQLAQQQQHQSTAQQQSGVQQQVQQQQAEPQSQQLQQQLHQQGVQQQHSRQQSRRRPASQQGSPGRAKATRLMPEAHAHPHADPHAGPAAEQLRPSRAAFMAEQATSQQAVQHDLQQQHQQLQQEQLHQQQQRYQRQQPQQRQRSPYGSPFASPRGPLMSGAAAEQSPRRSWVQLAPAAAVSPRRPLHAEEEPHSPSVWGPAAWSPTTVARHTYDARGQPSPRLHEESRWDAAVAAIHAASATAGATASPPVRAQVYPKPAPPPAATSPLRSHFPAMMQHAAAGAAALDGRNGSGVGSGPALNENSSDGSPSVASSRSSSSGSSDSGSGSKGNGSDGSVSSERRTPPLDFGRLRQQSRAAQRQDVSRGNLHSVDFIAHAASSQAAGKVASASAAPAAVDTIPANRGSAHQPESGVGGGHPRSAAAAAAGCAVVKRRSAAGVVTRAMGRQLRSMRDAAMAAASPRVDPSAAAAATQQQHDVAMWRNGQLTDCGAFPPEAVEAVLLWADPWLSARVFGGGLYSLICLRQVVVGALPLQPLTAVAIGCILWMAASIGGRALRRAGLMAPVNESQETLLASETARRARAERQLLRFTAGFAAVATACAALLGRCLSGRDKIASLWLALAMWAAAAVSESRLLSQPALLIGGWVALFALPPAYSMCRRALDALAEELLAAAAAVVTTGGRATAGLALGAAAAGWALGGPGAVGQATCAACAGAGAVFWRGARS